MLPPHGYRDRFSQLHCSVSALTITYLPPTTRMHALPLNSCTRPNLINRPSINGVAIVLLRLTTKRVIVDRHSLWLVCHPKGVSSLLQGFPYNMECTSGLLDLPKSIHPLSYECLVRGSSGGWNKEQDGNRTLVSFIIP